MVERGDQPSFAAGTDATDRPPFMRARDTPGWNLNNLAARWVNPEARCPVAALLGKLDRHCGV